MLEAGYYDISPVLSVRTAVFPGDVGFVRKVHLDFKTGGNLLLSSIETTLHLGAHADAPNHYHPEGKGIEAVSLLPYLGRCQVISVDPGLQGRIMPSDLGWKGDGKGGVEILAPRILFKTRSFPNPDGWQNDFNSLSPELVEELSRRGVILVGLDTPSVDPATSQALESHQAIYRAQMSILEGLILEEVPDGVYSLIALPLRIEGADASPVRAILLKSSFCFSNS